MDDVLSPLNDSGLSARVREKVLGMVPHSEDGHIARHHMFRGGDGGG